MEKLGVILLLSVFFISPSYGKRSEKTPSKSRSASSKPPKYTVPKNLNCDVSYIEKTSERIKHPNCTVSVVTQGCTYTICNGDIVSEKCVPSVEVESDYECLEQKREDDEAQRGPWIEAAL